MKDIKIEKTDKIFEFFQVLYKEFKTIPETDEDWTQVVMRYSDIIKEYQVCDESDAGLGEFITRVMMELLNLNEKRSRALRGTENDKDN